MNLTSWLLVLIMPLPENIVFGLSALASWVGVYNDIS
jgi:hypothetical protein